MFWRIWIPIFTLLTCKTFQMIHIRSCSHYHFKSWYTLNKLVYKQIYQQRYAVYWRVLQRTVLYSIFSGLQFVHCAVYTVYCTVQYLQCTAVYRIYGVQQCTVHRSVQNIQCTAVYSLYRY